MDVMNFNSRMAATVTVLVLTRSGITGQVMAKGAKRGNGNATDYPNEFSKIIGPNSTGATIQLTVDGIIKENTTSQAANVNVIGCLLKKQLHSDCKRKKIAEMKNPTI